MQRLRLALLLPLLLVLAQQGAMLHELSHVYYSSSTAASGAQLERAPLIGDNSPCATCLAFAQVATPAAASLAILILPPAAAPFLPEPRYSIVAAAPPTPRSRGPPLAFS